jgi:transposase
MAMTAAELPDDPAALKAMILARDVENARLYQIIKELQRHRFGRRAEALPEDQLLLGLEEAEQIAAAGAADKEQPSAPAARRATGAKRRTNRGKLPAHLPRVEVLVDIEDHACPCCRGGLHRIGEDVSERLDIIPAQLRVIVVRRPKYGCRACADVVLQALAPARLIEGGLPTEATVAQVLVAKYADHLPLYRQVQIWARQGLDLDRSTLADWVGRAAWHLRPLHERLLARLKSSPKLFAGPGPRSGRPPRRCSIPAAAGRRRDSFGHMPATTGDGAAPIRRASPMSMRPTARRRGRSPTSPASPASCRACPRPDRGSTAMAAIACWPKRAA